MSVRVGVIGVACPWYPPRLRRGQCRGHAVPLPQVVVGQGLANRGDAGAVAQRVSHSRLTLPARCELRPYGRNRIVETDCPAVDQLQGEQCDERFADRIEVDERVVLPRPFTRFVRPAAYEVHDNPSADVHADRSTDFTALGEVVGEGITNSGEPGVARPTGWRNHE